jgi:hypothetical protein
MVDGVLKQTQKGIPLLLGLFISRLMGSVIRRMECSFYLMIQNRQICYLDHTQLLHAALRQSPVLCCGEVDQLQEVVSTNSGVRL